MHTHIPMELDPLKSLCMEPMLSGRAMSSSSPSNSTDMLRLSAGARKTEAFELARLKVLEDAREFATGHCGGYKT